jgi:tetratricopeptide (TPR) repeat protein
MMAILMAIVFQVSEVPASGSSLLLTQAIELLQQKKRTEALRLLERAFERASDPAELQQIAVLTLEASALDYPKREAFLKYLVKFSADHPKYPEWLKELGDRSFQMGQMDAAEDWYLRAHIFSKSAEAKARIDYQLSFVYWNRKNLKEAWARMSSAFEKSEGLRPSLHAELARLWWEQMPHQVLPAAWQGWSVNDQRLLFKELFLLARKASNEDQRTFLAIGGATDWSKALILQEMRAEPKAITSACLFFEFVLKPTDSYPESLILDCLGSTDSLNTEKMIGFLEVYSERRSERFDLAHLDLLIRLNRKVEAARLSFRSLQTRAPSVDFLNLTDHLLVSLSDLEWAQFFNSEIETLMKIFLKKHQSAQCIQRLQKAQPDFWFSFQEKEMPDSLNKNFWQRKANWRASSFSLIEDEVTHLMAKIYSFELSEDEKKIQNIGASLDSSSTAKLPTVFGEVFLIQFKSQLQHIDHLIFEFQKLSLGWHELAKQFMQTKIRKNLESIRAQIQQLEMPIEFSGSFEEFSSQKQRILSELSVKYQLWEGGTSP